MKYDEFDQYLLQSEPSKRDKAHQICLYSLEILI